MVDDASGLASRVTRRLRRRGWTVSTAESCTGGLLASLITDISGATQWFQQGWVVYSNEAKMRELGVENQLSIRMRRALFHTRSLFKWLAVPDINRVQM